MKLTPALLNRSATCAWLLAGCLVVPVIALPVLVPEQVNAQDPGPSPDELFKLGYDLFRAGRYQDAIAPLEKFEAGYKLHQSNDAAILFLGICYAQTGNWQKGITMLEKLKTVDKTKEKAPLHEQALFYLGFVNYNYGMSKEFEIKTDPKEKDPNFAKRKKVLDQVLVWYTELFKKYPDTKFREDALFYSALVKAQNDDYPGAQKDLETLVKDFPKSALVPEYQFVLGQIFQTTTAKLALSKKGTLMKDPKAKEELEAAVTKTMEQYSKIADNKDAVSTANEAQLARAEMKFYLAALNEDPDAPNTADAKKDYVDALKEYRKVRRKEDVIASLERQKAQLQKDISDNVANQAVVDIIRPRFQRVISRIEEVKAAPDPRITAMIRMAGIYNELAQYGEARVLIRRLIPIIDATNKKQIESALILSYALDGADDKANEALTQFFNDYGKTDKSSEGVSYFIANALRRKDPPRMEDAIKNYDRSLKDFPSGAYAAEAQMRKATALVQLKKFDEATGDLQAFITKNPNHTAINEARYALAEIYMSQGKFDEAIKVYLTIKADPKAGPYKTYATWFAGTAYMNLGKFAEAIKEFQEYIPLAKPEDLPGAMSKLADAQVSNRQPDEAIKTYLAIKEKYPKDIYAPLALERIAAIYEEQKKAPEMLATLADIIRLYPTSGSAFRANYKLAGYHSKAKNYDEAAKAYRAVAGFDFTELEKASAAANPEKKIDFTDVSADALWRVADMYQRAAKGLNKVYSMMEPAEKEVWIKHLKNAQTAYIEVLTKYPEKVTFMGRTSEGLANVLGQQVAAGLMKPADVNGTLDSAAASITDPKKADAAKLRVELTKALMAADAKDPNALAQYQAIVKRHPGIVLAPPDVRRYGALLRAAGNAAEAEAVYKKVQTDFPKDDYADAEYTYGMGALALAKGDIPAARTLFGTLTTKYSWHPSIATMEPVFGLAQGAEAEAYKEKDPKKKATLLDEALAGFNKVIATLSSPQELKARSMYGVGKVLEAKGQKLPPPGGGLNAAATYYKLYNFYPKMYPNIIPDALWRAAKIYHDGYLTEADPNTKNEYKRNAVRCYDAIIKDYPDFKSAKEAAEAIKVLGPVAPAPAPAK
ncbi:MAG: tetratricopeptide repeat protein [Candidatus Methylacidiphilales bacterium]|nr:tetratricopeptide repeat protein [Candidatus Methylacidiphilales bacterium]